jgi:hypothetical protein
MLHEEKFPKDDTPGIPEPAWVGNLLACRFRTLRASERGEDGQILVIVPRFDGAILRRFLSPILRQPNFRIRLDQTGSAAWELCDGTRTGEEIAAGLALVFPDQTDLRLRLGPFLRTLARQKHVVALREE